ncbi:MAG: AAA family ATPase [Gammaproteobacteria bacterium]
MLHSELYFDRLAAAYVRGMLRSSEAYPDYSAYDTTRFEVIVLAGLPGVGKDAWIRQCGCDLPVISLDALRTELSIPPDKPQGRVIAAAKQRARELLRIDQGFIWNATNITRSLRQQLIDLFTAYRARVRIVYLDAAYPKLLRRNRARTHSVPEKIIASLAAKLDLPDVTEAHTVDYVTN